MNPMIIKASYIEWYDIIDNEVEQVIPKEIALWYRTKYCTLTQEILDEVNKLWLYEFSKESDGQQKKESC
jgi:hypothetical protein